MHGLSAPDIVLWVCYRIKILKPLGFNERIIQVIVDQKSDDFWVKSSLNDRCRPVFHSQKTFLLLILLNKLPEWHFLRGSLITNDFLQFKNWIICILLPLNHIIQKSIKLIKILSPCFDNFIFNLVIGAFDNISTSKDYSLFVRKNNASK